MSHLTSVKKEKKSSDTESKESDRDQESIQSCTTPDQGSHM